MLAHAFRASLAIEARHRSVPPPTCKRCARRAARFAAGARSRRVTQVCRYLAAVAVQSALGETAARSTYAAVGSVAGLVDDCRRIGRFRPGHASSVEGNTSRQPDSGHRYRSRREFAGSRGTGAACIRATAEQGTGRVPENPHQAATAAACRSERCDVSTHWFGRIAGTLVQPGWINRVAKCANGGTDKPSNQQEIGRARWADLQHRGENPLDCKRTRFARDFKTDQSLGDEVASKYLKWIGLADGEAIAHRQQQRAQRAAEGCDPP